MAGTKDEEMKLSISIIQAAPLSQQQQQLRRRSRSRKRGSADGFGRGHRSSLSPTSIIVDFDEFCHNLRGGDQSPAASDDRGDERRRNSSSSSSSSSSLRASAARADGESNRAPALVASKPRTPGRNAVGRAVFQMGQAKARMRKWDEALMHFDHALLVQIDFLGRDHEDVARTLIERGTAYAALGSWYDSILDLERGLHIQRGAAARRGAEEGIEIADTLIRVGRVQHRRGNYVESVGSLRGALTILRRGHGCGARSQHGMEAAAAVAGIIAKSQHQRRRYGEAIESYRDCLSAYEAAGMRRDHPDVAWIRKHMADRTMFANCVADFWNDSAVV